jgi:manganese transport protein
MKFIDMTKKLVDSKLWLFMGSGLIVSVAYIDPGNWGTNIGAGSKFNYALLWMIWLASGMAMLFQYL